MPARPGTSDLTILIVAGAVFVVLSIASFFIAPVDSTPYLSGSSYSPHPGGAKAAYLMLKESGYTVERSFEPITAIRTVPEHTLLVFADPLEGPSAQDVRALQRFLEAGGTVLATDEKGAAFFPRLPAATMRSADTAAADARTFDAAMAGPLTAGAPRIETRAASGPLPYGSAFIPVYGDETVPAVVMARIGKGTALWIADGGLLSNTAISRQGHAELLLNVAGSPGDRVVLWDEYYHGVSRSLWSYAAGTPLPFAGVHLALVAAVALLTWSRRKWPIRPSFVEPRTSPLEFIESMGALYARAGVATAAIATVRRRTRQSLVAATRSTLAATDRVLADAAEARGLGPADGVEMLLRESADASTDYDLKPDEAVRIVSKLQQLAAAVARLGPGRQSVNSGRPERSQAERGQ